MGGCPHAPGVIANFKANDIVAVPFRDHGQNTQDKVAAGIRRLYRFAAYNLAAVVVCIVLAATKAWWIALVALAPAAVAAMWIVAARRAQQRGSALIRTYPRTPVIQVIHLLG